MRQRRWIELIKDYDLTLEYKERKANMVADALSRKNKHSLSFIMVLPGKLYEEFQKLEIEVVQQGYVHSYLSNVSAEPELYQELREKQKVDAKIEKIRAAIAEGEAQHSR